MENSIIINSKEYKVPKFDFEAICELEDLGLDFTSIQSKSFSSIRTLVAYVLKTDVKEASKVIEQHIVNGGEITDFTPLLEALGKSDFFQAQAKKRKK